VKTVYYVIEWLDGEVWTIQSYSKTKNIHAAKKAISAWRLDDPNEVYRLVRVTTTEEREVVG